MSELTQRRLKELLHYDPEAGVFVWLKTLSTVKAGDVAGYVCKTHGYRMIGIEDKNHRAARLAWLYMEGYAPEHHMDHINRIKHDDRWKNLRHVSAQCNMRNSKTFKNNKSGITGVHWSKGNQKWRAQISILGKCVNLGRFRSKLSAARARWNAEVDSGFPDCRTTSTSYLYLKERGKA